MQYKIFFSKVTDLFNRFVKADIVRVFSLTSISTLVRMLTGLISVKVVASIIGPAGVALLGQLNNFSTIALGASSGFINNGVVKYVAEFRLDSCKLANALSTALRITVICSVVCGLSMIVLSRQLSQILLLTSNYTYVFVIFGFTILLYALNNLLASVINGFKEFKKYVWISIAGSLIGVIYTVTLVVIWQLPGALVSAVTFQSIMLFISLLMLRKVSWLNWSNLKKKINRIFVKRYSAFALMTLVSTICVPLTQLFLRGYAMTEISETEAGWWEGMNRISNMYLMVITSSFSVYYLPRLSEITDCIELRYEVVKAYKVIVPILLTGFALIYLLRIFIIHMLFTPDFLPMSKLFIWQLAGDFLKICSWLLAFLMVAKAMTKLFISTEIISAAMYIVLSLLFVRLNGIVGLCQGYFANYAIYSVAMAIIFRNFILKSRNG